MRILVTGGAGFIGSHACVSLLEAGYDIAVVDDLSNASADVPDKVRQITGKDFPFYAANIADEAALDRIFTDYHFDGVIHFAGSKAVGESVEKPLLYYSNNVAGSLVLFRAMERHGCRTIVFSSSATVYGIHNPIPYVETMPTSAGQPYGWTKVMLEQILRDVAASHHWNVVLLRYFNPIGAHESGLIGEMPNGIPNNLVPYIAKVATGKLPFLRVFGNDYPTIDGTGVRDYVHVVDLADGHTGALRYALEHPGVEAINLGTGRGNSVLEVLHAYEKACGKTLPYEIQPRRAGDIAEFYADATKAKELLGWTAVRSLDDMCRDSWRFSSRQQD